MRNSRSLRRRPPPRVGEVRGGAATSFVGAACATGRALPPLAQSQLAGIPRFEAVCVRGVRHPLPQGEWHAAPSYTWGSKRLNASTKRVSSGGLPPTPTWSQRRDWTRIVGASLRSRARRRRLLRRLRPCRRHVPGSGPFVGPTLAGNGSAVGVQPTTNKLPELLR